MARLAEIGPYFTVRYGERADAADFRPLTELYAPDTGHLAAYTRHVARSIRTHEPRVAASTLHLGLVSRLCSLSLGAAALSGRVPDLAPDRLHWRLSGQGALTLWLPDPVALPLPEALPEPAGTGHGDALGALLGDVLRAHLTPLDAALRARPGLSAHTLRGNAASALVGSLRVLLDRAPGAPHPPVAPAAALLDAEPFAGAGTFVHEEGLGVAFLRDSCCLYYRVPGGGLCGDCVLRGARARR